jgi:hypothetical protein
LFYLVETFSGSRSNNAQTETWRSSSVYGSL